MKAISPVIATVIIVAVAIAISIAVALWITGMTSSFTGVEKLEVVNAYAEKSGNEWIIHITVKNTGTKTATIDNIFINGKPVDDYATTVSDTNTYSVTTNSFDNVLDPGETANIDITISEGYPGFSSGQTISIIIHTASGGQYPATVTLP